MTSSRTPEEMWMRRAMQHARRAAEQGEVPVGCVVVCDGKVVGWGRNRREERKNALCHAELEAIHRACRKLGGWRLHRCDLYVTLEPCPMCAGAIINARIRRVYYGAIDEKNGACGSVINLPEYPFTHRPQVQGGVCAQECGALLTDFFRALRERKKKKD